jgi:hypothetical protein
LAFVLVFDSVCVWACVENVFFSLFTAIIAETQNDPKQSRSTLEDVLTLLKEGHDLQKFSSAHLRLIYKCIYEHLPRTTGVVSLRRKLSKFNRETVLETVAAMVDAQLTASQQAGSNRRGDPSCRTSAPGEASTHEAGGQDRDTSDKPLEVRRSPSPLSTVSPSSAHKRPVTFESCPLPPPSSYQWCAGSNNNLLPFSRPAPHTPPVSSSLRSVHAIAPFQSINLVVSDRLFPKPQLSGWGC